MTADSSRGDAPTALVKFGGEVAQSSASLAAVLEDVASLHELGWKFVLCHGGGPQASALQARLQVPTRVVGGRRVTDEATLQIMKFVLAGEVSVDIVAAAVAAGLSAVGIAGVSDALVSAHRRPPMVVSGGGAHAVDYGLVGDIDEIRPALLRHLWAGGYTPVLNTLGIDGHGRQRQVFNINADTVAAAVASTLGVDHLFLVTAVGGVLRDRDDPSSRIARLSATQARAAIAEGVIAGGMIPKVEEALANLARGIGAVHVLAPRRGALQREAVDPGSEGTVLVLH